MNTNDEKKEKLKQLLGADLSDAELKQILEEFSDFSDEADVLARKFAELREQPLPPLSPEFTEAVLARLSIKGRLQRWWEAWTALPRLAKYAAAAAAVFLAVYVLPPALRGPISPGFKVLHEKDKFTRRKSYEVRFAIQVQGAKEIVLFGDFNEWKGMVLKKGKDDVFHAELPLSQGTYAYGFMVDGKKWLSDPSSPSQVQDGFGQYNSVVNL